jgi:hypothetical protein
LQEVSGAQVGRIRLRQRLGARALEHDDLALVLARRRLDGGELSADLALLLGLAVAVLAVALGREPERVVQRIDHVRVVAVVLAAALAVAEESGLVEGGLLARERGFVPPEDVGAERVEADAADLGHREPQACLDDLGGEPNGFEDLRSSVAVDGGDAHLREDLQHAVLERGLQLGLRFRRVELPELVVVGHARHRLEREAGTHRVGAEPEEAGDGVHVASIARGNHDRRLLTSVLGDQPVVHRAQREKRRDRCPLGTDAAVGDDEHGRAGGDGFDGGLGQLPYGGLEPTGPVRDRERRAEAHRLEHGPVGVQQGLDRLRVQEE